MRPSLIAATFGLAMVVGSAYATTMTVTSMDVPKTIVDNNPTGFTSTLVGPSLSAISDVNLIFNDLRHTSVPDLHIELTSPDGTHVVLFKAFTEGISNILN